MGSAEDEKYDQVLDSVLVGPVVPGSYRFVFQADPPDPSKIPSSDVVGVTVLLLTCSYRDKEFIRVGYYVNTEYESEELRESPPETPNLDKYVFAKPASPRGPHPSAGALAALGSVRDALHRECLAAPWAHAGGAAAAELRERPFVETQASRRPGEAKATPLHPLRWLTGVHPKRPACARDPAAARS